MHVDFLILSNCAHVSDFLSLSTAHFLFLLSPSISCFFSSPPHSLNFSLRKGSSFYPAHISKLISLERPHANRATATAPAPMAMVVL